MRKHLGCLTLYASIPALLKQFHHLGMHSWKEVMDAAYSGDVGALEAVRREAEYLSLSITSLCNLLEPQAVVLAGDVIYRPNLLVALIRENVNTRRILRSNHDVVILAAGEVEHINLKAAASIVLEAFCAGELEI